MASTHEAYLPPLQAVIRDDERTIPNTPIQSPIVGLTTADDNGDFARLVPANRAARVAFSEIVGEVKSDSNWNRHAQRYIHINGKEELLSELSASETETEAKEQRCLWTGYYRFNINIPPFSQGLGWIAGSGRKDLEHGGVDFLLTSSSLHHVAGRHARFAHNLSGTLLIIADTRRVVLNGIEEFRGDQRAITSRTTGVAFGDLTYTVVFTELDAGVYEEQLSGLRKAAGQDYEPPPFLKPTPRDTDYELKGYSVKGVFAEGSTCTVAVGVNRKTGSPVAIKKMKRNRYNFLKVQHEVKVLKAINPHVRTQTPMLEESLITLPKPRICDLVEVLYIGGNAETSGPNNIDEVYLIYSPLAEQRFTDLILSDMSDQDRIIIIKHCIEGIGYIHGKGLMHRDIKPGNIAIVSCAPPSASLIDFGHATWEKTSMDHSVGTISYLAPEVMALKHKTSQQPYNESVDIWAIGISGYQLLCRKQRLWTEITRDAYVDIRLKLSSSIWDPAVGPVIDLIDRMVNWRSCARISAANALSDDALRVINTQVKDLSMSKRPRDT